MERKVLTNSLVDVTMNFIPCPSLCRQCKHFEQRKSNFPYHCHGGSTTMASYKAKNGDTFDDCVKYSSLSEDNGPKPIRIRSFKNEYDNSQKRKRISNNEATNKKENKINFSPKNWWVTFFLCLFLGTLGIHRFYTRKVGTGVLMLLTAGGFGIWIIIDLILLIMENFTDGDGNYIFR